MKDKARQETKKQKRSMKTSLNQYFDVIVSYNKPKKQGIKEKQKHGTETKKKEESKEGRKKKTRTRQKERVKRGSKNKPREKQT